MHQSKLWIIQLLTQLTVINVCHWHYIRYTLSLSLYVCIYIYIYIYTYMFFIYLFLIIIIIFEIGVCNKIVIFKVIHRSETSTKLIRNYSFCTHRVLFNHEECIRIKSNLPLENGKLKLRVDKHEVLLLWNFGISWSSSAASEEPIVGHGINVKPCFLTIFSLFFMKLSVVNMTIENIGTEPVYLTNYTPQHTSKLLSLTGHRKVTSKNPVCLQPGNVTIRMPYLLLRERIYELYIPSLIWKNRTWCVSFSGDSYDIKVKFCCSLVGFYPATLAFEFKPDPQASTEYRTTCSIEIEFITALGRELAPTAPYKPKALAARTPKVKSKIVDGRPPERSVHSAHCLLHSKCNNCSAVCLPVMDPNFSIVSPLTRLSKRELKSEIPLKHYPMPPDIGQIIESLKQPSSSVDR